MDREPIASYNRSWRVVESRTWIKIAPAGSAGYNNEEQGSGLAILHYSKLAHLYACSIRRNLKRLGSRSAIAAAKYLFPLEKSPSREGELMADGVWLEMGQGA